MGHIKLLILSFFLSSSVAAGEKFVVKSLSSPGNKVEVRDLRTFKESRKLDNGLLLYGDSNFNKPIPELLSEQLKAKRKMDDPFLSVQLKAFNIGARKTDRVRRQKLNTENNQRLAYDIALIAGMGILPAIAVSEFVGNITEVNQLKVKQTEIVVSILVEVKGEKILISYLAYSDTNTLNINIPIAFKKIVADLSDEIIKLEYEINSTPDSI